MIGQSLLHEIVPGTVLADRFEFVRFLGSGGMGEVVLVRDRNLKNARIVLKFLHTSKTLDEQQFLRFQNEAMLMRELNHPHIVHVYDFGVLEKKFHYLSMEFVPGQTLGELIRDYPEGYDYKKSLEILYQIALALSFAHNKGIVHRDLKPDNVLLDEIGDVRLTDFGLGKSMEADFSLTDTGQAVGTPHYMSPEQLRGEPAAPHSDVYSFGLVAYELITGKKAYDAESYLTLAEKHLRDPIPVFATRANGIPTWLQDFIEKCSAKSASKRFDSFAEIAEIISSHIPSTKRSIELEPHVFGSSATLQHWRMKWRFGKPSHLIALITAVLLFVASVVTIAVGRNNHPLRMYYAKYYYMMEREFGFRSPFFRTVFLGDEYNELDLSSGDLIYAVSNTHIDHLEVLLSSGMDPNTRTADEQTLVQLAIDLKLAHPVDVLARYGADFTVEDENRRGLLILATLSNRPELVASIIPKIPPTSLDINAYDATQHTALHYALEQGNVAIVSLLLKNGAAAHLRDGDGTTPLMYAVASKSEEILRLILAQAGGTDLNMRNKNDYTALHIASEQGNTKAVELLLTYNADTSLLTASGKTALELAIENHHTDVVELLSKAES